MHLSLISIKGLSLFFVFEEPIWRIGFWNGLKVVHHCLKAFFYSKRSSWKTSESDSPCFLVWYFEIALLHRKNRYNEVRPNTGCQLLNLVFKAYRIYSFLLSWIKWIYTRSVKNHILIFHIVVFLLNMFQYFIVSLLIKLLKLFSVTVVHFCSIAIRRGVRVRVAQQWSNGCEDCLQIINRAPLIWQ